MLKYMVPLGHFLSIKRGAICRQLQRTKRYGKENRLVPQLAMADKSACALHKLV